MVALRVQAGAAAHVAQLLAEHAAGRQIDHRNARYLGDVRNGTRGTRVDLDNVDLVVVQNELDVDQTENSKVLCQSLGVLNEGVLVLLLDVDGRIDGDGVAGVNACALEVLHDTRDEDVVAVTDGIDLDLAAHHVLIDQNGFSTLLRVITCMNSRTSASL